MKKVIVSLVFGSLLSVPLYAANPINRREHNQRERIEQGVKSGELTRAETKRLAKEEARIRAVEKRDKADGKITPREALKLDRMLDKTSRDIYKQKHDNQERN